MLRIRPLIANLLKILVESHLGQVAFRYPQIHFTHIWVKCILSSSAEHRAITKKNKRPMATTKSKKPKNEEPNPCETCGGKGWVRTMGRVYANEPHMADVDEEPCPDCSPIGGDDEFEPED